MYYDHEDCCAEDWTPYCDTCGDEGCKDCANGTVRNHDCARWQRSNPSFRGVTNATEISF
jgi:hypothetical protein